MERKLASIQTISKLEPIPGADAIEKATVLGWSLVVKKGDFKVGDPCIYFEVDSVLPERPEFEFLRARHFRIKTIKLKGTVSQGLAFPLTILPIFAILDVNIGDDVTEILGVKKYEPNIPAHLAGMVKGDFPSFILKTDETRIQSVPQVLERHKGKVFVVSEKLDGSSLTVYIKSGEFGVCSRNLELKETDNNAYWKVVRKLDIENKLRNIEGDWALQGELIGLGIQGNKYKLDDLDLRIFNVWDIARQKFLCYNYAMGFLAGIDLKPVPIVKDTFVLDHSIEQLISFVQEGTSCLNKEVVREGFVFRSRIEDKDEELGRLSFKVINPKFLLKFEE